MTKNDSIRRYVDMEIIRYLKGITWLVWCIFQTYQISSIIVTVASKITFYL